MARIIQCGKCASPLEVPDDAAGRKFRCPNCKDVLVAPAEEDAAPADRGGDPRAPARKGTRRLADAPPPSQEDVPPRRKAGGTTVRRRDATAVRRRDGTGVRKREEDTEPRRREGGTSRLTRDSDTRRRRRDDDAPGAEGEESVARAPGRPGPARGRPAAKKSPLLLPALAGAALLLGVAVVAAIVVLGGSPPAEDGIGEGSETPAAEETPSGRTDPTPASPDGRDAYRERIRAARDAGDWLEAGREAKQRGLDLEARLNFLKATELDPDLEDAWKALGYRLYRVPDDARPMLEAPGILEALKPLDGRWLDPRKFEEVSASEAAYLQTERERYEEQAKLGGAGRIEEIRARIHDAKGLDTRVWGDRPALPYFLFDERGKKGEKLLSPEDSEFLVNKKLTMLQKVYRFMEERWMAPLEFARDSERPLVAVIFQNRASFAEYNQSVGANLPAGALAYFSRLTKFIYMYDAASTSPDGQDHQDGILFHEATHQIVDAFLSSGAGMARVSYWFNEGIAEYVGSVKRRFGENDEVLWDFGAENPGRIREYWTALRPDLNARTRNMGILSNYSFSLVEILTQCRNPFTTMMTLRQKIPPQAWGAFEGQGSAGSLIYAQAYFILYFAYAGGKPEYREAMDRYLLQEFKGRGTKKAFLESFGMKGDEDIKTWEDEMLAFLESLVPEELKRKR